MLSAIITFVVQQVKKYAGTLDPKLLALAAPVITTALAVAVNATETASINPATAFYIGLAATGLYEVAKHFVPNLNETAEQKMGRLKADIEKLKATPK